MADRILRWYIDGNIARAKTSVGGTYRLDSNYRPLNVNMTCRIAGKGTNGTMIDILVNNVSMFAESSRPVLNTNDTEKVWTTFQEDVHRKGSIVTLDIVSVPDQDTCRDLTVELEYEEA